MPRQEQHTLVRFSLRSLLAITFGVALVMTVIGPLLREMPPAKQLHLLYALVAVTGGMACTGILAVRNRMRLGDKCGKLLVALEYRQPKNKRWSRWWWLLVLVPLSILYFFVYIDKAISEHRGLLSSLANMAFPFLMSMGITRKGLALWAEGYANAFEFCERGVVMGESFHAWDDPLLRQLYWSSNAESLVININRAPVTVPVPPHQREGIDAILEHYFNNRTVATDQT